MSVERLIYPPEAVEGLGLKYVELPTGGDLKKLSANIDFYRAIKVMENVYRNDMGISDGRIVSFRMGWHAAIVFERKANHFEVTRVCDIGNGGKRFDGDLRGGIFHQITTQAVDTCTVYYIDAGDKYIFAHFLNGKIEQFRDKLAELLDGSRIQAVFSSAMEDMYGKKRRAADEIKEYNSGIEYIAINRSMYGDDHYLSHMEWGIGMNAENETVFFGDVLHREPKNRGFRDVVQESDCDCFTFEYKELGDLRRLKNRAEELFGLEPEPGCGGGGGCIII